MKTCLICAAEQPNDAPTCSMCGEGSWSDPAPDAAATPEGAKPDEASS